MFARAGSINYVVTRKNLLNGNALNIFNPHSFMLFVAKKCAGVTFMVKAKTIRVITVGKPCPVCAGTRAVSINGKLGRPNANLVHAVGTL
jgi:hypothetical protein